MKRGAGIVMPITSLPSDYGIGTMGKEARRFIDFLHTAKQTYWQILPLGPTSYGDSPYQSFSSFAGNPYLIDLDELHKDGLLRKKEYAEGSWGDNPLRVDYGLIYARRYEVLRKAVARLLENKPADYDAFIENEKGWLDDYALFMTIKKLENGKPVGEWHKKLHFRDPEALDKVRRENAGEMTFWEAVQYLFFRQWKKLRQYAKKQNVKIIGDIPIYVAEDSVEVWADPKQFQLDKNLHPTEIAGCPPDGFAEDGQRWGNPLYDWEYMKKDGYAWWIRRVAQQFRFYDVLRLDHFRGFAGYYAIPATEKTARNGKWREGPGYALFEAIEKALGKREIIAEDLGFLTEDVYELLRKCGYAGMKNLQFAFFPENPGSEYLPHNFVKNCVVYVGTHDNEPIMGWFKYGPKKCINRAKKYLHLDPAEGLNWGMIRCAYMGVEDTAMVQFQDFLGLGWDARINTPSVVGINWTWRCDKKDINGRLAQKIARWTALYDRLPK